MVRKRDPELPLRDRIVRAAAELLAKEGRDAVSTRAVSAAAGVQAPAIYRQFADMRALLEAAATETLAGYVRLKAKRTHAEDPLDDLRRGWDEHIAFGLANPEAYSILYAGAVEPPVAREGMAYLEALLTRVAEAGRLRMNVEAAARLMHAGGRGAVLSLIAMPERDPHLADAMREAMFAAIIDAPSRASRSAKRVAPRAIALRAVLTEASAVTPAEKALLGDWLDRLAAADD